MDDIKLDKYAQYFAHNILEDVGTLGDDFKSPPFDCVDINTLFIVFKEFLLYDLHVCERCIFGFWGDDIRKRLMHKIISQIMAHIDKNREKLLDSMLDTLTHDNLHDYLYKVANVIGAENFIDELNNAQIKYSKYKLAKDFNDGFEGTLEWEFGETIASLAKHEGEVSFTLVAVTRARGFFIMMMETKKVIDELNL